MADRTHAELLAENEDLRARLADAVGRATGDEDTLARRALLSVLEDEQRANRASQALQERLDAILGSIDEAVWSVDVETGRILYLSPAVEAIYGRPVQAFLDTPSLWLDAVFTDDLPVARALERAVRQHGSANASFRIVRPDGEVRWIRDSATLVRGPDGRPARLDGVVADITESKRADQAVIDSERQFRVMVEQSIAGLFIVQDGKTVYVNPRFAEILGFDNPDQLIGSAPAAWVVDADRDRVSALYVQAAVEGGPIQYVAFALRRDGVVIAVEAHGVTATFRGRPAIVGLAQDVSEKKRAEDQIKGYLEQLNGAFMRAVEVAMNLSEMRDPYTAGHERRVAEVAVAIGGELGLDAHRIEGLRVAGYLHDVGKMAIPAELLSKPSRLTAIEYALVQGHAEAGYEVLKNVKFPWPVAEVALQHHERIDGSGYPRGLSGDEVLLESRIMAVADVVEAMASHRPYRPGLGVEQALAEVERGRGTSYDPLVADACLRLFRQRDFKMPV